MSLTDQLRSLLTSLKQQSPSGFAAAFQVEFNTPKYLFQTYADDWMGYYSSMGIVMKDPAVRWGFTHDGIASWSELKALDEHGVFDKATEYGLNYWAVMATSDSGSKSIVAFSRSDKDFTDREREQLFADFLSLHRLTLQGPEIEPEFGEMLLDLSIRHTHPKM
ncbi:autoinducer binding domain-containing protein [Qingshengfaniella alkalisoli]|uniref:Transcriptional regulator n=1 Tax=Qingshengfaniella alkalisoli TaxID=2599296 RepID=A0A5B8IZQ2_9RHOB|nr:autoinducer binding domain-containing protein [Qingshengfaniella alkalisoli]QDY71144.1 transcriptional regulator [Qingshengfaniella alkalisoli]